ncbi:mannose-6-phosphate isomerase, class I [Aliivibrio finisterrensis]|uniref:mannose-6-phosphate isomerase n=1 Tax=Aliivibrio finisterrensis TaxID=511998 RepID=A0A4Q5K8K7_9GAMM|nr:MULTISPECIES: mannose-6-phosphate isomerase, class I [Aliivibrio]MDD9173780.1 mannose-6-phosphate isomerase, class I [Aliivibrio sp. S3TY1]MDD9190856.1 mannose-6-phosphate isomerase, class I [Aliivibrio sp. S2TY2]RYU42164.1 mannose-6-phosphate isomerase, class I [Aliivibrio finisterrensis]
MNSVYTVEAGQRHYQWGSHLLYGLFGLPIQGDKPLAELWLGGHPSLPSKVQLDDSSWQTLDKFLEQKPLNFLFKVLSASQPLSLQVHPNNTQAKEGFERENAQHIPLDAPHRNYKDAYAKPEMVMALSPFKIMVGFKKLDDITDNLNLIQSDALNVILQSDAFNHQTLLLSLLQLAQEDKQQIIAQALSIGIGHNDPMWQQLVELAHYYPSDIGVLAPLYMNCLTLEPGEAMYLPAGTIHAYTKGTCIELMGCSDNVLRAGLTPKYIDTAELMACTQFTSFIPEKLAPMLVESEQILQPAETDFGLALCQVTEYEQSLTVTSRSILLVAKGRIQFNDTVLLAGQSLFIESGTYQVSGDGLLVRAFESK